MDDVGREREIAARHAEVVGDPPRILPLADAEMTAEQRAIIDRLNENVGVPHDPAFELPEYFRTTVKHPALFVAQLELGAALFAGLIPPRERELAVLRIAWATQAPYEWGEHILIARRNGITPDEIERVIQGPDAPGWTPHDAAVLRGVDETLATYSLSDATWDRLALRWSEAQLLEYPVLIGAYVCTAIQQNMLRMRLSATNPGLGLR